MDPDFLPFVGIDSETDHLPIGEERQHWNPEALRERDVEIERSQEHWRDYALDACRKLMA